MAWALIVLLANQYAFPANICCFYRGRPYANYPSGMLEVTLARVIHDVQLNHVLQVPDPCRWSSKACLLPTIYSVHEQSGTGKSSLINASRRQSSQKHKSLVCLRETTSTLYSSRPLLRYTLCYSYTSITQCHSTGPSWNSQDQRRILFTL